MNMLSNFFERHIIKYGSTFQGKTATHGDDSWMMSLTSHNGQLFFYHTIRCRKHNCCCTAFLPCFHILTSVYSLDLLKDEFPEVPVRHITNVLNEKKYLVDAYSTLESQIHNYNKVSVSFRKVGKARLKRGHEAIMVAAGKTLLLRELRTARNWGELAAIKRHQEEKAKDAEEANLLRAQVNGEMSEWYVHYE